MKLRITVDRGTRQTFTVDVDGYRFHGPDCLVLQLREPGASELLPEEMRELQDVAFLWNVTEAYVLDDSNEAYIDRWLA